MPALPATSKKRAETIISSTKTTAPSVAEGQLAARLCHEIASDNEVTNGGHKSESSRLASELQLQPASQFEVAWREGLVREAISWAKQNV